MKTQTTARTSPRNGKAKTFTPPSKPSPRLERSTFETSRLLEFFSEKELAMQIGHPPELWPLALLKELIDNSLDGVESADGEPEACFPHLACRKFATDRRFPLVAIQKACQLGLPGGVFWRFAHGRK